MNATPSRSREIFGMLEVFPNCLGAIRNADAKETCAVRSVVFGYEYDICAVAQQSTRRHGRPDCRSAQSIGEQQRVLTDTGADSISPRGPVNAVARHHDDAGGIIRQDAPGCAIQRRAGGEIAGDGDRVGRAGVGNGDVNATHGYEVADVLSAVGIHAKKKLDQAGKSIAVPTLHRASRRGAVRSSELEIRVVGEANGPSSGKRRVGDAAQEAAVGEHWRAFAAYAA